MAKFHSMAVSATLHCITGCSIGEIIGMTISSACNLNNALSIGLSTTLSFVFGYSLSMIPVVQSGVPPRKALGLVLAADSLSILTMEIVDNFVMVIVPGALNATLVNPLYWITTPVSLLAAFFVAVPVNQYLLEHGRGHALTHKYHRK